MELYNYFRSSASWRVRIALALKGVDYDYLPIHLVKKEQSTPEYLATSGTGLVPLLVLDDGHRLHQSMAIIEYLDETIPEPPLLPRDALGRARVRALAQDIACEIHPLNNTRVLGWLKGELGLSEEARNAWIHRWIEGGLEVVERQLAARPSTFCHGETPGLADCALVPQIFNAQRFNCKLDHVPHVMRVHAACMTHEAFSSTQPSACPDAE
jgi:maleylacetoacetate isomerase/maleylpyruvate isomerase